MSELKIMVVHQHSAYTGIIKNMPSEALTSRAQLVGRHPAKRKVAGLIPGQGTCLGYRSGPWSGHM